MQALDAAMRSTVTPDDAQRPMLLRDSAKRLAALGGSEHALEPIPRRQADVAQEHGVEARTSEP